jgi:fumarylpyruvate hydrolase
MTSLFQQPITTLPIAGSEQRYVVNRIYCIGRNYAEHAKEMGASPDRGERPVIFMKPADAIVQDGADVRFASQTNDLHHEIELVVALGSGGRDITTGDALTHVYGYAVGNDLTRRDLQLAAKKAGLPWDISKGFDQSAPCSAIARVAQIGHPARGEIGLNVNGVARQRGDLSDLLWSVPEMIAELSKLFELRAGDLIFTGTPSGVAAVSPGDELHGWITGVGELRNRIV